MEEINRFIEMGRADAVTRVGNAIQKLNQRIINLLDVETKMLESREWERRNHANRRENSMNIIMGESSTRNVTKKLIRHS